MARSRGLGDVYKRQDLARHLNFATFFDPCHTKRSLLLLATFDEVEVAHFENLKCQHAIREDAVR
jgi:hypothetical protein